MLFLRLLLRALRWRTAASLSVFLVAVVAVLSAVLGPVYLAAAGQRVLSDRLSAIPPQSRDIRIDRDADPLAHPEDLTSPVRDSVRAAVASPWFGPATVSQSAAVTLHTAKRVPYATRLAALDGQCAHLHFVQGACPSYADDIAVSSRAAATAGWRLGDLVGVATLKDDAPLRLHVAGIYTPIAPAGAYWTPWHYFDAGPSLFDGQLPRLDSLIVAPVTFERHSHRVGVRTEADVPLDVASVHVADESALRAVVASTITDAVALTHGDLNPIGAASGLPATLDSIDHELSLTRTLVDLATLQLAVLAICVLYAIVSTTATAHGSEVALARLRGRPARAVIAQGIAEPVVLVLLAAPVGAVLAVLAVKALAPHVLAHAEVGFPRTALLVTVATAVAAVAAAALAARRIVAAPVATLLRRGTETGASKTGLLVADVAALALAVAGLAQLHFGGVLTQGKPNPLSALAPTLLAVAIAIVGLRLVPYAARAALRATRDSSHLVPFLAVRQILRRTNSTRLALLVSVALALATLAVTTWAVGGANREIRAGNEAGAYRVLTVQAPPQTDLRAAVDAADPSGRHAMAVEILPVSNTQLMAVDTTRLAAVAHWRPDFASASLTTIARALRPRLPAPLSVTGRSMSLTLRVEKLARGVPLSLHATIAGPDRVPSTVALGALVTGSRTYSAALPAACLHTCRVSGFTLSTPEAYNAPPNHQNPAFDPELDAAITAVTSTGASPADNATWAAALRDANRWRQGGTNGNLIAVIRDGLYVQAAPPPGSTLWPSLLTGDAPEHVPALISSSTASSYPGQQRHDISTTGLDGNPMPLDGVQIATVLPQLGRSGVVADIGVVERAMSGPEAFGVVRQVWLSSASADVVQRLHAAGIRVISTDSTAAHRAVLDRTGPAYADTVFLLAALAATVLAIGGAVLAALVTARRRSYELAALEAVGVRPRTLRWASALEQGLLIGLGVVFGVVSGIVGSALALPSTPIFLDPNSGPPIEYGLPWRTLLVLVAALVLLLALLCVGMARLIERQAGASRLREAGA